MVDVVDYTVARQVAMGHLVTCKVKGNHAVAHSFTDRS
jgi:hypothetical protein